MFLYRSFFLTLSLIFFFGWLLYHAFQKTDIRWIAHHLLLYGSFTAILGILFFPLYIGTNPSPLSFWDFIPFRQFFLVLSNPATRGAAEQFADVYLISFGIFIPFGMMLAGHCSSFQKFLAIGLPIAVISALLKTTVTLLDPYRYAPVGAETILFQIEGILAGYVFYTLLGSLLEALRKRYRPADECYRILNYGKY